MTTPTDRDTQPAEAGLFEDLPGPSEAQVQQAQAKAAGKQSRGAPRLLEPNRLQVELRASDLESLLSATRASCSRCGCTPRWTAWAAGAKLRG